MSAFDVEARVRAARMNAHVPDACSACGGDYALIKLRAGGGLEYGWREKGEARCVRCGDVVRWSVSRPGTDREGGDRPRRQIPAPRGGGGAP